MLENILPVIIALIALQFIFRVMRKKKSSVAESEWKKIDYKKRLDLLLKNKAPDNEAADTVLKRSPWAEELSMIPDDMRDVRRDLNLIREAVSVGLKAKIGIKVDESRFAGPGRMFDEIAAVVRKHHEDAEG